MSAVATLSVRKRSGQVVSYARQKINQAVMLCLVNACRRENNDDTKHLAEKVTHHVDRLLKQMQSPVNVETIQDLVEISLMKHGEHEAAKQYILYREARRRIRERLPEVSEAGRLAIQRDLRHFGSDLQVFQHYDKYARFNAVERRRETFEETGVRIMDYVQWHLREQGMPPLAEPEYKQLLNAIYDNKALPAMRLMQMAGPAAQRCQVGVFNCLAVETPFVTDQGVKTFQDFKNGERVTVLTHTGRWMPAVVRSYGKQVLHPVVFVRGRSRHTVWATKNHRWLLADGSETTCLKIGDRLIQPPTPDRNWVYEDANPVERTYRAHGYVYGDGTLVRNGHGDATYSMVRLCRDEGGVALSRFVELGFSWSKPPSCQDEAMVYTGRYLKQTPNIQQDGFSNFVAFVCGYLYADGNVHTNGEWPSPYSGISTSGEEQINFIRTFFPAAGAYISREDDMTGQATNYGVRPRTSRFGLVLGLGNSHSSLFSVKEIGKETRHETVWCLEVEEDQSFVLPSGLVTGNCSYSGIYEPEYFDENLYISMQGTGCGFSCESEFVEQLPRIAKPATRATPDTFVVPDTTEGWCESVRHLAYRLYEGHDLNIDYREIRPEGAKLKIKGGTASGPRPLSQLHESMRRLFRGRSGQRLRDIDVHDIMCYIGQVGQMGGVRRAALISLSDLDSVALRDAKHGSFWNDPFQAQRTMSNNSAVYEEKPSMDVFMTEWLSLVKSKSGERGIFNRGSLMNQFPPRRRAMYEGQRVAFGSNPCLHPSERLHTIDGMIRMVDLYRSGATDTLVSTDNRVTPTGLTSTRGTIIRLASQVEMTQADAEVFAVMTAHGHRVRCTANHEFPTPNGRKRCDQLQPGDQLLLQSGEGSWGLRGEFQDGWLLGLAAGIGRFVYRGETEQHAYLEVDDEAFNLNNVLKHIRNHTEDRDLILPVAGVSVMSRRRYGGAALYQRLERTMSWMCGSKAPRVFQTPAMLSQAVPEVVWRGSRDMVRGYLQGLFLVLGDVPAKAESVFGQNPGERNYRLSDFAHIVHAQESFLRDVQNLLQNFGIVSFLAKRMHSATKRFQGAGKTSLQRCWKLVVNRVNASRLVDRVGLPGEINQRVKSALAASADEPGVEETFTTTVKLVRPIGRSNVYCLNEPDTHSIIVGGVVTAQCGEIVLHPGGQFCNLSLAVVRPDDTPKTLEHKIELAAIFGTIQASMTNFNYLRPRWAENCRREALLGVDLLGAMDSPLFRGDNQDRAALLDRLRHKVRQTNQAWAKRLGINPATAATCIKPGGNSGARFGTGQSMSGWLSQYMIRNVEVANHNPMCRFLKEAGVPNEPSYRDSGGTTVFSFPLKAPDGAQVVSDLVTDSNGNVTATKPRRTALDQLEDWLVFKKHWTDHNPSVTCYVSDHEWMEVGAWVYRNWDDIGGLAFLPLDGGVYPQAPFTPVTEAQYEKFIATWPTLPWDKLPRYEGGIDHTNVKREMACIGDKCVF